MAGLTERGHGRRMGRGLELAFASDLHLGSQTSAADQGAAFGRFLAGFGESARGAGRQPHLVLLGDTFDLPMADVSAASSDEWQRRVIEAVDGVAAAHPRFFLALGRFLASGGEVSVVAGNHDLALSEVAAWDRLRDHLGAAGVGPGSLAFHAWFVHLPGSVHAEHGHQYHDINSVRHPVSRSAGDAPLTGLVQALGQSGRRVAVLSALARRLIGDPSSAHAAEELHAYGLAHGIEPPTVERLNGLRADPGPVTFARVARLLLATPLRSAAPVLALTAGAVLAAGWHGREAFRPRFVASILTLGLSIATLRAARAFRPPPRSSAYLLAAAPAIARALEEGGHRVPYLVFGHTHIADSRPLGVGSTAYLNCGTWLKPAPADDGQEDRRYPFVRLSVEAGGSDVEASLCHWNDAAGRIERAAGRGDD